MTKKQLTLKQAEAQMDKFAAEYRIYVTAQIAKGKAKTAKEQKAQQAIMDGQRDSYTAFRNAYRAFRAQGGVKRVKNTGAKRSTTKRAASKPKTTAQRKRSGKRSGKVTSTKLSPAAMKRRSPDNPLGLTPAQLAKAGQALEEQVAQETQPDDEQVQETAEA